MAIFFPSLQPSLASSCKNGSRRTAIPEAVLLSRKPMRKIFPVCCADAGTQSAESTAAKLKARSCFFICAISRLTNNFGRPRQQVGWYRQTDLLCRLEIDHKLEFRRLLHRQIGRLGSLQALVHEICHARVAVHLVRTVGHEPAGVAVE